MTLTLKQAFVATSLALLAVTCSAATEPGTWDKIKDFTHAQKNAAVAEGRKLLNETDKQLAVMKKQAAQSTGEAKAAHQKNMEELQAKRKEAKANLDKLQKSGSNAWDATKQGFGNAYQDLHLAWRKAVDGPKDAPKK